MVDDGFLCLCLPREADLPLAVGPLFSSGHLGQSLYLWPVSPHHLQGDVHLSLLCDVEPQIKHLPSPLLEDCILLALLLLFLLD